MDEQRAWIKSRRNRRLRLVAVMLCLCLLFTTCSDILETLFAFAADSQNGNDVLYVCDFSALPEEVREQTVFAGTGGVEQLSLPDKLEAIVVMLKNDEQSENAGEGTGTEETGIEGTGTVGAGTEETGTEGTGAVGTGPEETGIEGTGTGGTETEGTGTVGAGTGEMGTEGTGTGGTGTGEMGTGDAGTEGIETGGTETGETGSVGTEETGTGETGTEGTGIGGMETENPVPGTKNGESTGETAEPGKEDDSVQADTYAVSVPEYYTNPEDLAVNTLTEEEAETKTETKSETREITIEGVVWESTREYDGETEGTYIFNPILPEGYALAEGVSLPQITVTVTEDLEGKLRKLTTLLEELPDPFQYLSFGEADESIINKEQLVKAREAADAYLAEVSEIPSVLEPLLARLEGLEHIRDTEADCMDFHCPYHYPEIIQKEMEENEIPQALTLEDLVEDYGVEAPVQPLKSRAATFSTRAVSTLHPQTLMLTNDNENNSHTGQPDGDIDKYMRPSDGIHPIEVSFTLDELPAQSAYLAVKAYDVDEDSSETDYVYINDDIYLPMNLTNSHGKTYNSSTIGYLSGTDATWNTSVLEVPIDKLKTGKNVISITIAKSWAVEVDWMQLILDGGTADTNIEEFSLKLQDAVIENNNVTVQSLVTVKQKGTTKYATEYTLTQVETGNALDACFGQTATSENIGLTIPLSSPTGIYRITGILKNSSTEEIKATDSIDFHFIKGVGLGPKVSHTLTPAVPTRQNVTIKVSAEAVPEMGITDVTVSSASRIVSANGTYSFTVNYKRDGESKSCIYKVTVDHIDKEAPVIKYTPVTVQEDEPYETVKELFAGALSVSDNRKLADAPYTYTIPSAVSNIPGTKTITVKATDSVGNTSTKSCTIMVEAKPINLTIGNLTAVSGSKDSFALKAVLDHAGDNTISTITETGFVWGVMQNPTLDVKNGSVKTSSVVKTKGGTLNATATGLVSGVTYYARAYARVTEKDGSANVVYSDARQFGFEIPAYGTFSVSGVSNSGTTTTFTITRSGGTDRQQTVYYRTVNGSAIGGTHFTHKSGTVTFAEGVASKTVTVTELGVTKAYNSDTGTMYSNADRTYSLEIYRIEGGGKIDPNNRSKTRTMTKNSSYTIDRSIYTNEKSKRQLTHKIKTDGKKIADTTSKQGGREINVHFLLNRDGNENYNTSSIFSEYYTDAYQRDYLNTTASGWYYRYELEAYEQEDGYEHAYIGTSALQNKHYDIASASAAVSGQSGQLWACNFQQGEGDSAGTYYFPDTRTGGGENSHYPKNSWGYCNSYNNKTYVDLKLSNRCYIYFGSTGSGSDIWYVDGLVSYALVYDKDEPELLGIAPMAGGTYLPGDPITVALVFNEIVDSNNSSLNGLTITTNAGTLTYAGGADTNVLYFTGNVASSASLNGSTALKVTGISKTSGIKDMCGLAGSSATFKSGNTNVIVDTTKPAVTINPITTGSLPRHQAKITATGATTIQYAWTKDTNLPAYGWSNVTSGTTLTGNQDAGTAGTAVTWYLHVLATSSSGAMTHACQAFSFQQPAITSVSVRAGYSTSYVNVADVWKPSKYIVVQYAGTQTTGTTLTFDGPQTVVRNITAKNGSVYLCVTKNGTYTVTLKDSYGNVVSKTIEVKKIDTQPPTATIRSGSSTASDTVYHSLALAVLPADTGGSGIAKVEYAWTNTTAAPGSWTVLTAAADGSYKALYSAIETTKTAKYLQVRVTDGAGNVSLVARSGPYQVVKAATGNALPKISVTGNPTAWKKSASLKWTVTKGTGTGAAEIESIFTPEGSQTGDYISGTASGTSTITKNGNYVFMVTDKNGNSAIQEVLVIYLDNEAPKADSLTATGGKTGTVTLKGVTDSCTVRYDQKGNYSSMSGSGIKTRQYRMESGTDTAWKSFTGSSFTVNKNGTYIVRLTDNVGNYSEYSVEMTDIDATAPYVSYTINATKNATSGWYTSAVPVVLAFEDRVGNEGGTPSGIQSVQYKWVTDKSAAPTSGLSALSAADIAKKTFTCTVPGHGTYYLYYKVTDKKGNITEGFSEVIQRDSYGGSATITGPNKGKNLSEGLDMHIKLWYGPAGGCLYGNATQLKMLEGFDGIGTRTVEADYKITNSGTKYFRYYRNAALSNGYWYVYVRQITFNSQGGSAVESQLVWDRNNSTAYCYVTEPAAPVRTGYTFGGWYTDAACTDGNKFDFSTTQVRTNTTLYAKWTANTHTVSYHLTNPDGSTYIPDSAYGGYTYGKGLTLPVPAKEGYTFCGWYTKADYSGTAYTEISGTETGDKEYYGYFKDVQAPKLTTSVESGTDANDDAWYNRETMRFALNYSDNDGVTKIESEVDDSGFVGTGSVITAPVTEFSQYYDCQEGVHTYTFKAADQAGNETVTEPVAIKWDKTVPEIGEITCEKKIANILDWIIGKESLIIHITVSDAHSGAKTLTYTETTTVSGTETSETKTVGLSGKAGEQTVDITFDARWKGRISDITCTDTAGNHSASKSIEGAANGIIIEDNPPVITIKEADMTDAANPKEGGELSENFYEADAAPVLYVSVVDEGADDPRITAGIGSVTYRINGDTEQKAPDDFTQQLTGSYSFIIPLTGKAGVVNVTVKAADYAGNTAAESVIVKIKGKEETPKAVPDYPKDALTGLVPGATYEIKETVSGNDVGNGATYTYTADDKGDIPFIDKDGNDLCGKTVSIVRKGDGTNTNDSEPQRDVEIKARPDALNPEQDIEITPEIVKGSEDAEIKITIDVGSGADDKDREYSTDGGNTWQPVPEDHIIKDLKPGDVLIRDTADEDTPYGEEAIVTVPNSAGTITVVFDLNYENADSQTAPKSQMGLNFKDFVPGPAAPSRDGYEFMGWYKEASCQGDCWDFAQNAAGGLINKETPNYETGADQAIIIKLYAKWRENIAPNLAAVLSDHKTADNWYSDLSFMVTYSDNEGVTNLYVRKDSEDNKDSEEYVELPMDGSSISGNDPAGNNQYQLTFDRVEEGEHTYTFKAVDAAGNVTETKALAKLDKTKPELGEASFNTGYKNLWNWIIRKDSLEITLPVTEAGSGINTDNVVYTLTSAAGSTVKTDKATVEKTSSDQDSADYTATIYIAPDFKGTVAVTATDNAGNISATKTIGTDGNGIKGVIIEDNAPVITILADHDVDGSAVAQGMPVSEAYYNTAPKLLVTVKDDDTEAVTGGLKSVSWKIGDGEEQFAGEDFSTSIKSEYSFTIVELEDKTGIFKVTVNAEDQAGNTASETVTVKIKTKEALPNPVIDYQREQLTGLSANGSYVIGAETVTADAQGYVKIKEEWFGSTVQMYKKGGADGSTLDSDSVEISIAERPAAPSVTKSDETIKGKKDGTVSGIDATMEYSTDGGQNWISIGDDDITNGSKAGLASGEIWVRVKATATAPHGKQAAVTIAEGRTLTVVYETNGGSSINPMMGKSWHDTVNRPETPEKEGYTLEGWYRDSSFLTAWHFADEADANADQLTDNITLYAKWKDAANPNLSAVLADNKDANQWYQVLSVVLTYLDNEEVTKLYVKKDNGNYTELSRDSSTQHGSNKQYQLIYESLEEGKHTYMFKAEDAAGNVAETGELTAQLDTTKPVLGEASCKENLWGWIISRERLEITVPVTEAGSGVDIVDYTLKPAGGQAGSTGQAVVKETSDGSYTATFGIDPEFKGSITISARDKAGNISDTKTIGTDGAGIKGIIVENNAPTITVLADRYRGDDAATETNGVALSANYYESTPVLVVKVEDDVVDSNGVIASGLASISWKNDDDGTERFIVEDFKASMQSSYSFTISDLNGKSGVHTITIEAKDQAGNSANKTVTVKIKGTEEKPNPTISYSDEKLTRLEPNADYYINNVGITTDEKGEIKIEEYWFGTTISIYKPGDQVTTRDSEVSQIAIPSRVAAPNAKIDFRQEKLTGLEADTLYLIDSVSKMTDGTGTLTVEEDWMNDQEHSIIKETDGNYFRSSPQKLVIPIRPAAPNGVTGTQASKKGVSDGKLTGLDNRMEYKGENSAQWIVTEPVIAEPDSGSVDSGNTGSGDADSGDADTGMGGLDSVSSGDAVTGTEGIDSGRSGDADTGTEGLDSGSPSDADTSTEGLNSGHSGNADTGTEGLDSRNSGTENEEEEDTGLVIEGLSAGCYLVRFHATDYSFAGKAAKVDIGVKPEEQKKPSGHGGGSGGSNAKEDSDELQAPAVVPIIVPTEEAQMTSPQTTKKTPEETGLSGDADKPGAIEEAGKKEETEAATILYTIINGRIVPQTGNGTGTGGTQAASGEQSLMQSVGKENKTAVLTVDQGKIVITVNNVDEKVCAAEVSDAVAVANAVLSEKEIIEVSKGKTIEIRIDVEQIDELVTQEDKQLIEQGIENSHSEIPGLTIGMYIDISVFLRVEEGKWNEIKETNEPVEIIIDIPEELQAHSGGFYIARVHESVCVLMEDLDDVAETITIQTSLFSTYAIVYEKEEALSGDSRCSLCHICPTFLGICCFIWLAVIAAVVIIAAILYLRKKQEKEDK